jgi:hypothetical protein
MSTATQRLIEGDLSTLQKQKQGYELALKSAQTPATRERHLRNVARLDEEIAGRLEALRAVTPPHGTPAPTIEPGPTPRATSLATVDVTGPFAALLDDPGARTRRIAMLAVAVAFGVGFAAVAAAMVLPG